MDRFRRWDLECTEGRELQTILGTGTPKETTLNKYKCEGNASRGGSLRVPKSEKKKRYWGNLPLEDRRKRKWVSLK